MELVDDNDQLNVDSLDMNDINQVALLRETTLSLFLDTMNGKCYIMNKAF